MKHTYKVALPDGTLATRRTARTYTYMVACTLKSDPGVWCEWSWCGRSDLAEAQARQARSATRIAEVRVFAVTQPDGLEPLREMFKL